MSTYDGTAIFETTDDASTDDDALLGSELNELKTAERQKAHAYLKLLGKRVGEMHNQINRYFVALARHQMRPEEFAKAWEWAAEQARREAQP